MAIITHRTSKNARYADVIEYYKYKHYEEKATGHYEPILDEYGLLQERDKYRVMYIDADGLKVDDVELWASSCMKTNLKFNKNNRINDRKIHEYIISFTEEDRKNLTEEKLLEIGEKFAHDNLRGYDVLIGVHRDTDNDHIHISFNSVRAEARPIELWMEEKDGVILNSEFCAGGKHQDGPKFKRHRNEWLLQTCREYGLFEKDNNAIAEANREKRYNSRNGEIKNALLEAAAQSKDFEELRDKMKSDFNMELKLRGQTISVLYPDAKKAVRLRTLGLETVDLTQRMDNNKYIFDLEKQDEFIQKEIEKEEQKKFIEWVKERRERNNAKAEQTILASENMLEQKLKRKGQKYVKADWSDLNYLIKQNSYLESNLQTEIDKMDKLIERWQEYFKAEDPAEKRKHKGYVKWCGCDADNEKELADLLLERNLAADQKRIAHEMIIALNKTSEQWKGHNKLNYTENSLEWTKIREKQLKQQLKEIKKQRKKLWNIACNCGRAAERRTGLSSSEFDYMYKDSDFSFVPDEWKNYVKFHNMYRDKFWQIYRTKKQLAEIKKSKVELKQQRKELKKQQKEMIK